MRLIYTSLCLILALSYCHSYRRFHYEEINRRDQIDLQRQLKALLKQQGTKNDEGQNWAVLVAGSNNYYNYRHQADICHAYHIMRNHGIPESNIITMMYDDIAYNEQNKRPGVIINQPNGKNLYPGVVKDYTGEDVTPENFLKVLVGDEKAGGKVLKSGPNDKVFVYFADHGAPGILGFPTTYLKADDLSDALKTMNENQMYKELVFYVEACESGSMFEHNLLPANLSIYGLTAANDHESSYACYLDKTLNTYLGDCFSVAWMEDTDKENINTETLEKQYKLVKNRTTESHVQQYGDLKIVSESVGEFQGSQESNELKQNIRSENNDKCYRNSVRQEEVPMIVLTEQLKSTKSLIETEIILQKIRAHKNESETIETQFENIINSVIPKSYSSQHVQARERKGGKIPFDCYSPVIDFYNEKCMKLHGNSQALTHLYKFVNLCQMGVTPLKIMEAINENCK